MLSMLNDPLSTIHPSVLYHGLFQLKPIQPSSRVGSLRLSVCTYTLHCSKGPSHNQDTGPQLFRTLRWPSSVHIWVVYSLNLFLLGVVRMEFTHAFFLRARGSIHPLTPTRCSRHVYTALSSTPILQIRRSEERIELRIYLDFLLRLNTEFGSLCLNITYSHFDQLHGGASRR
ncbi:hypothetical protein BDV18DRAFT_51328 [Aspergillus unguis]